MSVCVMVFIVMFPRLRGQPGAAVRTGPKCQPGRLVSEGRVWGWLGRQATPLLGMGIQGGLPRHPGPSQRWQRGERREGGRERQGGREEIGRAHV